MNRAAGRGASPSRVAARPSGIPRRRTTPGGGRDVGAASGVRAVGHGADVAMAPEPHWERGVFAPGFFGAMVRGSTASPGAPSR